MWGLDDKSMIVFASMYRHPHTFLLCGRVTLSLHISSTFLLCGVVLLLLHISGTCLLCGWVLRMSCIGGVLVMCDGVVFIHPPHRYRAGIRLSLKRSFCFFLFLSCFLKLIVLQDFKLLLEIIQVFSCQSGPVIC